MSITDNLNKLFAIKAQAEALAVQINALHAGFTAETEIVAAVLDQSKTYIWQTPEGSKILFFREGKLAINDAADSSAVSSVISSVGSLNAGIALVEYGVSGKEMGVGEITCELKVTDSMTGELIAAALDRRVGRKSAAGVFGTWHSANAALQYWAKRSRYSLCKARGGVNCIKP